MSTVSVTNLKNEASATNNIVLGSEGNVTIAGALIVTSDPVAVQTDIGTAPNEIPLNQYLGNLAYQDAESIAGDVNVGGLVSAVGLQTSRTAVTAPAASDGNVFSGTYTPTLTNTLNVAASTAVTCQYMRVGKVVTVSGQVNIDATATGDTVLGVSLPIASNFGAGRQCGGVFSKTFTASANAGAIYGDATNNRATFRINSDTTADQGYTFTFTYQEI
jgi:hypothetical protein